MGPGVQGMPEKCERLDFSKMFSLTNCLEHKTGITGVPFGRTELSICGNGTTVCALLRRDGPVGPCFQGMPEESFFFMFIDLFLIVLKAFSRSCFMEIVNEHGWISVLRAENDTK